MDMLYQAIETFLRQLEAEVPEVKQYLPYEVRQELGKAVGALGNVSAWIEGFSDGQEESTG